MKKRLRKKIWRTRRRANLYEYRRATPGFCRRLMKEFGSSKEQWALTLKVGDFVEDCRFKKVKIASIEYHPYEVAINTTSGMRCSIMPCCDEVSETTEDEFPK